jgi:hypothetical protein
VYLLGYTGIVEDVVGGEKFVYPPKVSLSKDFVEPPADQDLVLFGHRIFSLASYQQVAARPTAPVPLC